MHQLRRLRARVSEHRHLPGRGRVAGARRRDACGDLQRHLLHRPREVHRVRRLLRSGGVRQGLPGRLLRARPRAAGERGAAPRARPGAPSRQDDPRRLALALQEGGRRRARHQRTRPGRRGPGRRRAGSEACGGAGCETRRGPGQGRGAAGAEAGRRGARAGREAGREAARGAAPGTLLRRRAADRLRSAPGRARLAAPATPLATRRAGALAPGRRAGSPRRARRASPGPHRRGHRRPPLLQPPAGDRGQRLPEPGALPGRDPGARGERRTGGPLQPGRPQVDLPRARARLRRGRVPDAREPLRRRALRRGAGPRRPLRTPRVAARPPGRPARGRARQRERRRLRRLLWRPGPLRREARARPPLRLDLQDRGPRRRLHPAPRVPAPPPALVARRRARTPARDARLRLRAQPPGRHFRGARAGRRPAGAEADVRRARLSARVHDARVAPRPGRRLPAPLPGQDPRGHPAEGWRVGPAVPASAVLGCGRHLPARTVTDEELARDLGASGARLAELTGVTRRHYADDGHGPSDLAREAALAAREPGVLAAVLHSDPDRLERFWCEFPASRHYPARMDREAYRAGRHYYQLDAAAVHPQAREALVAVTREVLARAGVPAERVALFLVHYLDARVAREAAAAAHLPGEPLLATAEAPPHIAAASLPIALADALAAGRVGKGDLVCCVAFGAGMSWGGVLLRL